MPSPFEDNREREDRDRADRDAKNAAAKAAADQTAKAAADRDAEKAAKDTGYHNARDQAVLDAQAAAKLRPGVLTPELAKEALFGGHRLSQMPPDNATPEQKSELARKWVAFHRIGKHEVIATPYNEEDLDKIIPPEPYILPANLG